MNDRMELLAPAGDEAALRAAVCAGADAVYLCFASFGARAAAANFDAEALEKAVAYAHLYRVRVYVTVNTLVKQSELPAVLDVLATVARCKADAVIVQDAGVLRLARESFPGLALHASTQMGIHTAAGARFAQAHGLQRAVLARECTLPVARAIGQSGIQTEVFVHGALCAGVSGQCLLSSMAGGRSGNRGRCAQPCRQAVTLGDTASALLSMKDLCLRDHLPELWQAGVTALKIEGRLKRPEYVAVVTQSYRNALDALARGEFAPADENERNSLLQIFHRGGFTAGHLMGAEDAALCATERVGHGGVAIGTVLGVRDGLATASLRMPLHDGDSLRVDGATDVELRYAGHTQRERATLRLRAGEPVRAGDAVYRTADAEQLLAAQALLEPTIPVWLAARVMAGEPMRLVATDGASTVTVTGAAAQTPVTRALTGAEISRQLGKLGDTPFALAEEPTVDTNGAFAPVSALNALRRDALDALAAKRRDGFVREAGKRLHGLAQAEARDVPATVKQAETATAAQTVAVPLSGAPATVTIGAAAACPAANPQAEALSAPQTLAGKLAVSFSTASLGKDFLANGANLLLYAPRDLREAPLAAELDLLPVGAWLALPPQLSDEAFAEIVPLLAQRRDRLAGVALGSVGQMGFDCPLPVALGEGVPMTNREALRELFTDQHRFCVLWPELSFAELRALEPQAYPTLIKAYGRERVMLLNHCPERVARGLSANRATCALCAPAHRACASAGAALTDRRGYRFPLLRTRMPEGCVVEVYNALPTDLSRQESRRRELMAGMLLGFTVEPAQEQLAVTARFAEILRTGVVAAPEGQTTSGHFLRGVE